jgi:hypothetical protein
MHLIMISEQPGLTWRGGVLIIVNFFFVNALWLFCGHFMVAFFLSSVDCPNGFPFPVHMVISVYAVAGEQHRPELSGQLKLFFPGLVNIPIRGRNTESEKATSQLVGV